MTKRTLLIDGDILAYQTAAAIETVLPWDEEGDLWSLHFYPEEGYSKMDTNLTYLKKELKADAIIVCLTDTENFRYDIDPSYKSNRKSTRKPYPLPLMREYLEENYETYIRPTLEADDVMGILATNNKLVKGEKVIVSIDKDMFTIPAKVFNMNRAREALQAGMIDNLEEGIRDVTKEEADRFHLYQTLIGDTTDGYSGCPGVGPKVAEEVLDNPTKQIAYEHTFLRGPRKGMKETRYKEGEPCSMWEAVVSQFKKAGLNEKEAIVQARLARILRTEDYDFKKKQPKKNPSFTKV